MQTYWDLTAKERANLTQDELVRYYEIAAMEAGAVIPRLPEEEAITDVEVCVEPHYRLTAVYPTRWSPDGYHVELDLAFLDHQQAAAIVDILQKAQVVHLDTEYVNGKSVYIAQPVFEVGLTTISAMTQNEANRTKMLREATNALRKARDAKRREYEQNQKAYDSAISSITEDYEAQRDALHEAKALLEVFKDYVRVAEGDETVAFKFLHKRYPEDEIARASTLLDDVPWEVEEA